MKIGNDMKKNFIIMIIGFLALGFAFELATSFISLESKQFICMNSLGEKEIKTIITEPILNKILGLFSMVSFSLSFSIFIAAFISSKVEKKQLKIQHDELMKFKETLYVDVHDALFAKIIPKEIFKVIKSDVINNKVIRRDAEWFLDFTDDTCGKIFLRITCRYKAYNNCTKEIENPIIRLTDDKSSKLEKVLCTLDEKGIVYYDCNNEEESNGVKIINKGNHLKEIHYELKIPPKHFVEYTTVFKSEYDKEVIDSFFTALPQIDLSLIATYPPEYEFTVCPSLSSELVLKLREDNRSIYKAEGGILPKQGIVYTLKKRHTKMSNHE